MSVENFFPEHYPWQRLLSDIHKKLVPEDSEDDEMFVEIIYTAEGEKYEANITAGELFDAAKTKLVYSVIDYGEESGYSVAILGSFAYTLDDGYAFVFNVDGSEITLIAASENDKPATGGLS